VQLPAGRSLAPNCATWHGHHRVYNLFPAGNCRWEQFKPELVPLPEAPAAAAAPALPPFVEPDLPTSVQLAPPKLLPVPPLPPAWKEVVAPAFV
jgi:hypothetical protein